ncbi:MAG TPA: amino acid racemase [Albidovulum sp.]|uniref:aspartate/glutamate racemase family protein n=1 Tax=Albidovulum sp. TaxID=1872424 RepID=UPI002CBB0B2E|nr:amino acid racemase [Albidovulum sp.]
MKLVGVLGGMGPEATVLLMQKVIALRVGGGDGDHIPLLVHQNPQVPSRIAALIEGTGESPAPVLAEMARALEAGGAKALAMPCNTAHAYGDAVQSAVAVPFFDMIALSTAALAAKGRRIGMLASPAVHRARVFDAAFAKAGLAMVLPEDEAPVLDLIRAVKAGRTGRAEGAALAGLAEGLVAQGADHIAIACTELSLLTPHLPEGLQWTDTLDCLAAAIVRFSLTGDLPAASD